MIAPQILATAVVTLLLFIGAAVAGDFSQSCANYYLGNGISDHTGELFIEAWCHGGQDLAGNKRPDVCNRLKLTECFKNIDGEIQPFAEGEARGGLESTCDIESCAIRQPIWDGPLMSCYCLNTKGEWVLSSINLDQHIGNQGGDLECGSKKGTKDCLYPYQEADL